MIKVFGFGHRSRMGKNTAGTFLTGLIRQSRRNVLVVNTSFAYKLKMMCYDLYKWTGLKDADFYELEENATLRDIKLPHLNKTPVELWIEFGMLMRGIYEDTWVQYPFGLRYDYLILTDVRFENEVDRIHKAGGLVYEVFDPRTLFRDSPADTALANYKKWDGKLVNSGSLKEFNQLVIDTFKGYI